MLLIMHERYVLIYLVSQTFPYSRDIFVHLVLRALQKFHGYFNYLIWLPQLHISSLNTWH